MKNLKLKMIAAAALLLAVIALAVKRGAHADQDAGAPGAPASCYVVSGYAIGWLACQPNDVMTAFRQPFQSSQYYQIQCCKLNAAVGAAQN